MFRCDSCEVPPPDFTGERADIVYYFGRPPVADGDGGEVGPRVHWFEMRRHGRGWSAVRRHMEDGRIECPCLKEVAMPALSLDGCRTLGELKRMSVNEEQFFSRVVVAYRRAQMEPCKVYQLVISGMTEEERARLEAALREHGQSGKTHDFCAEEWVDRVDKKRVRQWAQY